MTKQRDETHLQWTVESRGPAHDFKIFSVYQHQASRHDSDELRAFTVVDSANWVNIIALTPDDKPSSFASTDMALNA